MSRVPFSKIGFLFFLSFILLFLLLNPALSAPPDSILANSPIEVVIEGFRAPTGLAIDPSNNLYFSDTKEGSVLQLSPERSLIFLTNEIKKPRALVLDQSRGLFISADRLEEKGRKERGLVLKLDPQNQLSVFASGFKKPKGLTLDSQGNLYLSSHGLRGEMEEDGEEEDEEGYNGTIFRIEPGGNISQFSKGFKRPDGLSFDDMGNIYVGAEGYAHQGLVQEGSLFKISPDGQLSPVLNQGTKKPHGIARDALGAFFFASEGLKSNDGKEEAQKGIILKVLPDNTFTAFASGLERPEGLALDTQGNLYVADSREGKIYKFIAPSPPLVEPVSSPTNRPTQIIKGTAEKGALVTIMGGELPVNDLSDGGAFSLEVPLNKNQENHLIIYSTGASGNGLTSVPTRATILHDDVPPSVIILSPAHGASVSGPITVFIDASDDLSGMDRVELIVNGLLRATATSTPYTFLFDTTPLSDGPNTLTAKAVDKAGNESIASIAIIVTHLRVKITSPIDRATINQSSVLVQGTIECGAPEVGVTVNGILAHVNGPNFLAEIPLTPGAITITAFATDSYGSTATDTITVIVQEALEPLLTLSAFPASGLSPLTVTFSVSSQIVITHYELDFDGNGTIDLSSSKFENVSYTYTKEQLSYPTLTVTDEQGNSYTTSAVVNVFPIPDFVGKWNALKAALAKGDIEGALTFISEEATESYHELFQALGPDLSQVAESLPPIIPTFVLGDLAEAVASQVEDGRTFIYFIYFVKDKDGLWKIGSM